MPWRGGQAQKTPYCGVNWPTNRQSLQALLVRLGENLRRERRLKGYTQEQLAELVDLHPRVVQKIEAGKTNILVTTAIRIQAVLDCQWPQLLPKVEAKKSVLKKSSPILAKRGG